MKFKLQEEEENEGGLKSDHDRRCCTAWNIFGIALETRERVWVTNGKKTTGAARYYTSVMRCFPCWWQTLKKKKWRKHTQQTQRKKRTGDEFVFWNHPKNFYTLVDFQFKWENGGMRGGKRITRHTETETAVISSRLELFAYHLLLFLRPVVKTKNNKGNVVVFEQLPKRCNALYRLDY